MYRPLKTLFFIESGNSISLVRLVAAKCPFLSSPKIPFYTGGKIPKKHGRSDLVKPYHTRTLNDLEKLIIQSFLVCQTPTPSNVLTLSLPHY